MTQPNLGTPGNDSLPGTIASDTIDGLGGNDFLSGLDGNDSLQGGNGDDFLSGNAGNDTLNGGAGYDRADYRAAAGGIVVNMATGTVTNDGDGGQDTLINIERVIGSAFADAITGSSANDDFSGGSGSDTLDGAGGFDFVWYGASTGAIVANLGTGVVTGGEGTDTLISIEGIAGSNFADTITGSSGNDYIRGDVDIFGTTPNGPTGDIIDAGAGYDTIDYRDDPGAVNINLSLNTATDGRGGTDTIFGFEEARGSAFNDTIIGSAASNRLEGRAGDDSLVGGDGADSLIGGIGNDTLNGGAQRTLVSTADLNPEFDIAFFSDASAGVTVSLGTDGTAGTATGGGLGTDTLIEIEMVIGSGYADVISGSNRNVFEIIRGGAGNDTLSGGAATGTDLGFNIVDYRFGAGAVTVNLATGSATGADGNDQLSGFQGVTSGDFNDRLIGDAQDNYFEAGAGNDTIDGSAGRDLLSFSLSAGGVTANLTTGTSSGAAGTDSFTNVENLRGSEFADTLLGSAGDNDIQGRDGNDSIDGAAGNDTLYGGYGNDTLTGGAGNDVFAWQVDQPSGIDTLTDVQAGDKLNFSRPSGSLFSLQTTVPSGDNATGLTNGQVMLGTPTGGITTLYIGTDDTVGADITIQLQGSFAAGDFSVFNASFGASLNYNGAGIVINGTSGNDSLNGTAGSDTINGLGGNDSLWGSSGNDSINGGDGDDFLAGDQGNDTVHGGLGNDYIVAGGVGEGGSDVIDGGDGFDTVAYHFFGTDPVAFISTVPSGTQIDPLGGTDTFVNIEQANIFGGSGNDTITGDSGRNYIQGNAGNDSLTGGGSNDTFAYDVSQVAGTDTITDLQGGDNLTFYRFGGAAFVLQTTVLSGNDPSGLANGQVMVGTPTGGITSLYIGTNDTAGADLTIQLQGNFTAGDFSVFNGSFGASLHYNGTGSVINGTAGNDSLSGTAGADTINGLGGNDSLNGGMGNDSINGGDGNDQLRGDEGNDTMVGGEGNDYITGGSGDDSIVGGNGVDTADYFYSDTSASIVVNLLTGTATGGAGNDTLSGIENVNGSDFGDTIVGDAGNNFLEGRGGNDNVFGGAGSDFLVGGAGNDTLDGGVITDLVNLTDLNVVSYSGAAGGVNVNLQTGVASDGDGGTDSLVNLNFVQGSGFNDVLRGSNDAVLFEQFEGMAGNDTIDGGTGAFNRVTYISASGSVSVNLSTGTASDGYGGTDTLININHVRTGNFNDNLIGSDTTSVTEVFDGRGGNDSIDGRGGIDEARYDSATTGVNVNLVTGIATDGLGGTDTLVNIENIRGSNFNDTITGCAESNRLEGRAGDDSLVGGDGADSLLGGTGNDTLDGGTQRTPASSADLSQQYDIAFYSDATSGVTVALGADGTNGSATGGGLGADTLINIEMVIGSGYADVISGSNRNVNEIIRGGAGNDTLSGGAATGTDLGFNIVDYRFGLGAVTVNLATGTANGADGNDQLTGFQGIQTGDFNDSLIGDAQGNFFEAGGGNDTIDGGAGIDRLSFQLATGSVTANLATGTSSGAAGNDSFTNIENLRGSEFADTLLGSAGDNDIQGRDGNDSIDGAAGNDTLYGGYGNDTLTGGAGNDVFAWQVDQQPSGTDTITDWQITDQLSFTRPGGAAFALQTTVLSGDNAAGLANGQVMVGTPSGGTTTLYIGANDTAGADITLQLVGNFAASNFAVRNDALGAWLAGGSTPVDTTAPTVLTFNPTDEASGVTLGRDIVVTFSEVVQRGTGNIVLKTAAGATVATYDAATSANLSIEVNAVIAIFPNPPATSTLTINPSNDLTPGTTYLVEFAAGSIKDLAGNAYAGTTSYNFTTASSSQSVNLGSKDDFAVLQPSTTAVAGAGVGNDIYLFSGSMIPAGKAITISDTSGTNLLQFAPGLSVASSQVSANALKLTLSNGGSLTVLGAGTFSYDVGGNLSAGLDQPHLSFSQFVQAHLGTTVPTGNGLVNGTALSVGSGSAASLLASTASGDDFIAAQVASTAIIGGGTGNDTYLLSNGLLPAGTNLSISDTQGANSIQLASGLQIASAQVGATALKLNLASGASITMLGAHQFTYEPSGNTTAGINQADLSFAQFVQTILGASVPTTGLITITTPVTIGGNATPVSGNQTVMATAQAEVFSFDVATALADVAGTNTQAGISGFSVSDDRLRIDLPTANSALTTLAQLSGVQGVSVQTNPFAGATLVNFGSDANGAQPVTLTLVGITDPATVMIQVV